MNGYPIATAMVTTPRAGRAYQFEKRPGPSGWSHKTKTSDAPHGSGRIRFETRRAFRRGVATGPTARGVR